MNHTMAIKVEDLIKTFDGIETINRCNLNVPAGSIYGLLGANGAGKTTIFKLPLGLLVPMAGNAEALGLNVTDNSNEILKSVGSLIEVPVFYEHLTAYENLEIHLAYMGTTGDIKAMSTT
jgi:ABC-2 type transport system ATP-binding protein